MVPDPHFHPRDPRSQGRADNAGFSVVLVLAGFLALLGFAMAHHPGTQHAADTRIDQPVTMALQ